MPHKTNGRFPWEREKKLKAAAYYRDLDATRFLPYEEKFSGLLRMLAETTMGEFEIVIVARPEILGDDYEELVANLFLDDDRRERYTAMLASAGDQLVSQLADIPGPPTMVVAMG